MGVTVEPGTDCPLEVHVQREEEKFWFVRGTMKTVHSRCENAASLGDKPTFHASECLVFKIVGKQTDAYPWEGMRLILNRVHGRWVVLFEGLDVSWSDGGQALWRQRVTASLSP